MANSGVLTATDFKTETKITWCAGCGDYGVLASLQKALASLNIPNHQLLVVSGIGCSSNLPNFVRSYGFHSLHGRSLPVAAGAKLANHGMKVVITGGDGDGYGIGLGHFIHSARRNFDLTYIVMDNEIYGLTTGQCSPTSERNMKTKSTPQGNHENPVNPITMALSAGASFVGRGFSGEPDHLSKLMADAIAHKGFSLVDVFSPCVTYNHQNTYPWFKERVYKLEEAGHSTDGFDQAISRSLEWGAKIPIGLFYKADKPIYEEEELALKDGPLALQKVGHSPQTLEKIYQSFI